MSISLSVSLRVYVCSPCVYVYFSVYLFICVSLLSSFFSAVCINYMIFNYLSYLLSPMKSRIHFGCLSDIHLVSLPTCHPLNDLPTPIDPFIYSPTRPPFIHPLTNSSTDPTHPSIQTLII